MNNIKIATLLTEAAELLNESEGITRRYKLNNNDSLINIEKIPKEISEKIEESKKSNISKEKLKTCKDIIKEDIVHGRKIKEGEHRLSDVVEYNLGDDSRKSIRDELHSAGTKVIKKKKLPKRDYDIPSDVPVVRSKGRMSIKSYKLHKKINDKVKKSQNESIAVLLTEAAELLNESSSLR